MLTLPARQSLPTAHASLLPREHGAYFQLGLPLATALAATRPTPSALWLTAASAACFLAFEPLRVALGRRGARLQREYGLPAWRQGGALAVLGLACGVLAVLGLEPAHRPYLALPIILGLEVLLMTWGHQERTVSGEVLAALALSACAVPVALAGGMAPGAALSLWGTFGLGFSVATVAVHTVIRAHKPRLHRAGPRAAGLAAVSLGLAAAVTWAVLAGLSPWRVVALLPPAAVALGACALLPPPRHLKRLGWSFAAAGLVTTVLLAAGLS
jgi:hypothetical protein